MLDKSYQFLSVYVSESVELMELDPEMIQPVVHDLVFQVFINENP